MRLLRQGCLFLTQAFQSLVSWIMAESSRYLSFPGCNEAARFSDFSLWIGDMPRASPGSRLQDTIDCALHIAYAFEQTHTSACV
jgi:hypothetical protein